MLRRFIIIPGNRILMSAFSRFTPLANSLPSTVPFVGPEAIERQRGLTVQARIGANENGFGPAPSVLAAIRAEGDEIWKYNDPENFALRQALGRHLGTTAANIAVGGGVDELLGQTISSRPAPLRSTGPMPAPPSE